MSKIIIPDLNELAKFLVKAKKNAWAGDANEVEPTRLGFKRHVWKEGDWEYEDEYTGHYCAPGQEFAKFQGRRVWAMSYDGGMKEEYWGNREYPKYIFEHLKKALLLVTEDRPFRGPSIYEEGDLSYHCAVEGDIKRFLVGEFITDDRGKPFRVFTQNCIGGLVI